jgi:hypothetical protein
MCACPIPLSQFVRLSALLFLLAVLLGAPPLHAPTLSWAAMQCAFAALPLACGWAASAGAASGRGKGGAAAAAKMPPSYFPLPSLGPFASPPAFWAARGSALPAALSLAGSWAGACAAPLDWDEPWQAWPVASTYGSVGGLLAGLAVVAAFGE